MTALITPLIMSDGTRTRKVSTVEGYVQAEWDGYHVIVGTPPDEARDETYATLDDIDQAVGARDAALRAGIPQAIVDALASSATPVAAATAAVGTALNDAGILHGAMPYAGVDDVALAFLDSAGRRSWLEIARDGSAPPRVRALLAAWVAANLAPGSIHGAALHPDAGAPTSTAGITALWAVVDSAQRLAAYITPDGAFDVSKLGPNLQALVTAAAGGSASSLVGVNLPLVAWGDSLTEAGYPALLAAELGVPVSNGSAYSIGGQTWQSIAARQGGRPAVLTADVVIPADTSAVTVTLDQIVYSTSTGTGTRSGLGSIYGIPGTLTRNNVTGVVTFARTTAGTATWVPASTPYIPDAAVTARDKPQIIWSGRNGFQNAGADVGIPDYIRRMVTYSTSLRPRFLVLEIPPFVGDENGQPSRTTLNTVNAALLAAFPREFVPIASYLRSDQAFTDAGVAKTAQDATDIGLGLTPTSFRSDGGHPNATGNSLIAKYVAKHVRLRGWVQ